jgi:hypothetical protein
LKSGDRQLNQIQFWFLSLIIQVGPGAPRASLLWDTNLLDIIFKVYEEKIRLILFIRSLGRESLSRQIYDEQKVNNWPGLARETAQICQNLGIEDENFTFLSKDKYIKLFFGCMPSKE